VYKIKPGLIATAGKARIPAPTVVPATRAIAESSGDDENDDVDEVGEGDESGGREDGTALEFLVADVNFESAVGFILSLRLGAEAERAWHCEQMTRQKRATQRPEATVGRRILFSRSIVLILISFCGLEESNQQTNEVKNSLHDLTP